ncbi:MAG TPA: ATP-binding protein [Trebonia sp.]
MATGFMGRKSELAFLGERLEKARASGSGVAVAIRGRHRAGKSRLVQEFCDDAGVPYLYYTATRGASPVETVRGFLAELRESALPRSAGPVPGEAASGWPGAFRALAAALPDAPSIVVLDEYPWLAEQDTIFDGALQAAWGRLQSQRPVLLLLLGSDAEMIGRLTAQESTLCEPADNLVLGPLNPAEVGAALSLGAADAIDAHLISGGLPGILRAWPAGVPALEFAERECEDPASPLFGVPEATLVAEFPAPDTTRRVIEAIGGGSRTHAAVASAAGSRTGAIPTGTLSPLLSRLITEKRVLAIDEPLSTRGGKPALYRVADSSLGFYLEIGRAVQEWAHRGRPASAVALVRRRWSSWRVRAVEPVIREALSCAADVLPWPDAVAVGGWWTRTFETKIDIIGADRSPGPRNVFYAGSIRWLSRPFDDRDLGLLRRDAPFVPGFHPVSAGLLAVSLRGFSATAAAQLAVCWGPEEVIAAYRG